MAFEVHVLTAVLRGEQHEPRCIFYLQARLHPLLPVVKLDAPDTALDLPHPTKKPKLS